MAPNPLAAPLHEQVTLGAENIRVTRNAGQFVTAEVREPSGTVREWVLGMDVALNAGCEMPQRPDVVAWQPKLDEQAGEVAAAMRVPFYRRMRLPKRGRKRR